MIRTPTPLYDLGSVYVAGALLEVGAVYRKDVHEMLGGGSPQRGITRVPDRPITLVFTGQSGRDHGYFDSWDEYGNLHYYGQGRTGDMQMIEGNKAIAQHQAEHHRLLVFQALGKGMPVRFLGEFCYVKHDTVDAPDATGKMRKALVFELRPLVRAPVTGDQELFPEPPLLGAPTTTRQQVVAVRQKQEVFRLRLTTIEAGCRLTKVADLRFLRASHMKPWAVSDDTERLSRDNGLLLTPSADHLFDRGWISFQDTGKLLVAQSMSGTVKERLGLDLTPGRDCGKFSMEQAPFLEYHRDCIFKN